MASSSLLSRTRTLGQSDVDQMPLVGADLRGMRLVDVDLSAREMQGVDLRRATLVRVRMCGADLRKADLRECSLRDVDLSAGQLQGARMDRLRASGLDLRRADLSGANLSGCFAPEVKLSGATLQGADLRQARLEFAVASGADFGSVQARGVALDGADLQSALLQDADLTRGSLEDCDLRGSTLAGARLTRARLRGIRLQGARVQGLILDGLRLPKGALAPAQLEVLGLLPVEPEPTPEVVTEAGPSPSEQPQVGAQEELALVPGADLAGADLSGRKLRGLDLSGGDLRGADLSRADLREARLDGARMEQALLDRARLDGASLRELDGPGLSLIDASLLGVDLRGARLHGALLAGVRLNGAQLAGAQLRAADLRGANLSGLDLAGVDLRGAQLAGADLGQARLGGASMEISDLEGAYNLRPEQIADLRGVREAQADTPSGPPLGERLRELGEGLLERAAALEPKWPSWVTELARLETLRLPFGLPPRPGASERRRPSIGELRSGADLARVDLRGRRLVGLDLAGADLRGALLSGARISGSSLAGADLRGARMQGTFLRGVRLASAKMGGSQLQEARLEACDLRGADLGRVQAEGARFEGCQWRGASLAGAQLLGADLRGAALVDVDLRGAELDQASLLAADLDTAQVQGADLGRCRGVSTAQRVALRERGLRAEGALLDALEVRVEAHRVRRAEAALARREAAEAALAARLEAEAALAARLEAEAALAARLEAEAALAARLEAEAALAARLEAEAALAARLEAEAAARALSERPREEALQVEAPGEALPEVLAEAPAEPVAEAAEPAAEPEPTGKPIDEPEPVTSPKADPAEAKADDPESAQVAEGGAIEEAPTAEDGPQDQALPEPEASLPEPAAPPSLRAPEPSEAQPTPPVLGATPSPPPAWWTALQARVREAFQGPELPELVPGAVLAGLDLRRADLDQLDLSGADLRGAKLAGVRLHGTLLEGADLSGADLRGARLSAVSLRGACLDTASLNEARLREVDLREVRAKGSSWHQARIDRADMAGMDLREANLEAAAMMELDFADVDLRGAQLEQTDLSGAQLEGARLEGVDLSVAFGVTLSVRGSEVPELSSAVLPWVAGGVAALLGVSVLVVLVERFPEPDPERMEQEAAAAQAAGELKLAVSRWEALAEGASTAEERTLYRREQAALLERSGQAQAAQAVYLLALKSAEAPEDVAEISVRLGVLAGDTPDVALEHYARVLSLPEAPVSAVAQSLVALEDLRDSEDPSAEWRLANTNNSGRRLAVSIAAAQLLSARGEVERALGWLEQAAPASAAQSRALAAARAEVLVAGGDLAGAHAAYVEALAGRPWRMEDGPLRLRAAALQAQSGDAQGATAALAELQTRSGHPWVQARAALLLAGLSPQEEAVALLEEVLRAEDRDLAQEAELALVERLGPTVAGERAAGHLVAGDAEAAGWLMLAQARSAPEQGEAVIEAVLALEGGAALRQAAQLQLAELRLAGGDSEGAIRALRSLRSEAELEQQAELDARIAQALLEAGRHDDARFAFEGLLEQSPTGSEAALRARLGLAQVDEAQGALEQARSGYEAVLAQEPGPELRRQALHALAGNALERGEPEAALALWQQALQDLGSGAGDFTARLAVADAMRAQGRNAAAQRVLAQAQPQTPSERAWQQIALAELAEEQGDLDSAEAIYLAMLADPELPADEADPVSAGLARVRAEPLEVEAEDPGEADWEALQQAQALLDTNPQAGVAALEALKQAQDSEVRIQALLALAALRLELEDSAQVLDLLDQAQDAAVGDKGVWQAAITSLRVQALLLQGETEQAQAAWLSAWERAEDNEDLASQAGLGLAEIALSEGEAEDAVLWFERVLSSAQDPGWKERAQMGRARARVEAGDLAGAREDLEALSDSDEDAIAEQAQGLLQEL